MVTTKLTTDLSVEGFSDLLTRLVEMKKDFKRINDKFLDESLKWLQTSAQAHINSTVKEGSTGNLASDASFEKIRESDLGILRNIATYKGHAISAYVEFGTGVVGSQMPHELASELGWVYDVNSHGEAGWNYFDDQGIRHWTKGQKAHRFMYNALTDYLYGGGKEACMEKAMESFG